MSPEAFSDFGRQQQFHKSLLERMYDLYPDTSPSKVMLCENYRSNRAIIEFTSELFYDHKLKASKDPIAHSVYYPLTFFTARGEEVQHENSSGYYNTAEVCIGTIKPCFLPYYHKILVIQVESICRHQN